MCNSINNISSLNLFFGQNPIATSQSLQTTNTQNINMNIQNNPFNLGANNNTFVYKNSQEMNIIHQNGYNNFNTNNSQNFMNDSIYNNNQISNTNNTLNIKAPTQTVSNPEASSSIQASKKLPSVINPSYIPPPIEEHLPPLPKEPKEGHQSKAQNQHNSEHKNQLESKENSEKLDEHIIKVDKVITTKDEEKDDSSSEKVIGKKRDREDEDRISESRHAENKDKYISDKKERKHKHENQQAIHNHVGDCVVPGALYS